LERVARAEAGQVTDLRFRVDKQRIEEPRAR
jgi:hypothetical protein